MASRRYRMSTIERAETLLRTLDPDDAFRASRPLGFAYLRVVDIEHPCTACPDHLVRDVDPLARLECVYPDSPEPTTP
jgi:hypothetical protein